MHRFVGLISIILKRDRFYLPIWIICLILLAAFYVPMMPGFIGVGESAVTLTNMLKNPAMVAMMGLAYGDGMGAMYALMMMVWSAMGVAIFNILFVVRHTRKEEELGLDELIVALPVGRNANLLATLIVALAANLLIALGAAAIITAMGVEGITFDGALIFSLALGACGFFFAAITALFAQLFSTARTTNVVAFVLLGVMYMVRAVGDLNTSYELLARLSPLGLIQRTQAWVENYIWPILVLLAASLCIAIIAFALSSKRDVGAGLLASKPGKKHAPVLLANELGLAWRLARSTFIGWFVVMLLLGASYGAIIGEIGSFLESNQMYLTIIGTGAVSPDDLMNAFLSFIIMLMAVVSAFPVCMLIFRLKSEERHGFMEQVLAKSVDRNSYLFAYIVIAAILALFLLAATPLGMYLSAYSMVDTPPDLLILLQASLNYLPALLILIGLCVLLLGLAPKFSAFVWVIIGYCFLVGYMGNLVSAMADGQAKDVLNMMLDISPFSLLPMIPVDGFNLTITLSLSVAAIVFAVLGSLFYRKRDIKENI